jgi:F420-dependent oxidoreductase-like protein
MEVGIQVEGQEGLTAERWAGLARRVEELGLHSLWRSDHFVSDMGPPDRPSLETWTSLAALALLTTRIEFGTLVSPMTFRHPALLARMAAAVDNFSAGRLTLGLGAGWNEAEHAAYGIGFPPVGERILRLEEGVAVIRALWTGGPVSLTGRYFPLREATGYPLPRQDPGPKILLGGDGDRMLRLIARAADEWNSTVGSPEAYRQRRIRLVANCLEIGRDPDTLSRSWMGGLCIGSTPDEVDDRLAWSREFLAGGATGPDLVRVTVDDLVRDGAWVAGTPDQVAGRLAQWGQVGVQRVMLQWFDLDDLDGLALVADVARAVA